MNAPAPDFVFYLSADWESFHRPDMLHAFAEALAARGGRLLAVDRLLCPFTTPLRGLFCPMTGPSRGTRKWARHGARVLLRRSPLEQLAPNFFLGRAFTALDDRFARRSPAISSLNRSALRAQVRGMLARAGMSGRPLVSWFHSPLWKHYHGMLDEALSVYECYDEHTAIAGMSERRAAALREAEQQLFSKAGLVFVTSRTLLESKRRLHEHVHLVPNAANLSFFSRVQDPAVKVDPEFAALPRPVVGYLGTIHEHLDIHLLLEAARARPHWTFVLVGKVEQRKIAFSETFQSLQNRPNVRVLGWVERERLLGVCRSFDVAVIPYRRGSEFNRFVNPNKLHEYTAMGKPIVALEGTDLDSHRDVIEVVPDLDSFLAAVERAWQNDSPERIARRLIIAAENSWEHRVREMLARVDDHLARAHQRASDVPTRGSMIGAAP